jgi:hypothetical protein
MSRIALAVLVMSFAAAAPAAAQQPIEFLPRFDFHLTAEHLSHDSPRFVWEANFGGDIDIIGYGRGGRATFEANYQTILGEELKKFDPNQGNYILAGSASIAARGVEIAGVFYHQSRHLGDRFNRTYVDWNMLGGRVSGGGTLRGVTLDARADLRGTLRKAFVDYNWELDSRLVARRPVAPHVLAFGTGAWRVLGTDGSRFRGTQNGFRGEGGVRLEGTNAVMEFFVAAERRIDPYPTETSTASWVSVGFRLLSR